ncbi:MAG: DeoR/GlpR family DNA-binding transcription regulator [bacterium]|nr:DeoR/GlpR family DNA-binding transcription regulator [bacterium]
MVLAGERQERIRRHLEARGGMRTSEIAEALSISLATARRDLKELAARGIVERTHGGALPSRLGAAQEPPFAVKAERMRAEKERIAERAAHLVPEGSTVVLDSGTTTLALARRLAGRRLTIIALDLPGANAAARGETDVWLTGGKVRSGLYSLIGRWTEETLRTVHADFFFLAADAVDLLVVSNSTVEEAAVKGLAMNASEVTILVADHSKFGRRAMARVCALTDLDRLITDRGIGSLEADLRERVKYVEVV